jgi:hypothetical protein
VRSPFYEKILDRQGVKWEYVESFPLEQINEAKSRGNQARLSGAVVPELVEAYALMDKEAPGEAPPLVAWRPSKGSKAVLIDGNNRHAAYLRNSRRSADAYLVSGDDPKVIDRVTWTWNNLTNGLRLTAEEAMEHAVSYVRKYRASAADVAREWGVDYGALSARVRCAELRESLQRNEARAAATLLSDGHLLKLAPVQKAGEDLFRRAAAALAATRATVEEADDLARAVKRASTAEGKLRAVEEYEQSERSLARRAETKNGRLRAPARRPGEQLTAHLKAARNLLEDYDPAALRPVGETAKKEFQEVAADVVRRLTNFCALGEVPQKARLQEAV